MNIDRLREVFVIDGALLRYAKSLGTKKAGAVAGGLGNRGYWVVGLDGKRLQAHRVIFAIAHGYLPEQVDHINGDRSDNRLENLRAASNAENHRNTGLRSTNKSGVKGVYWNKSSKRWMAACRANGRQHTLGPFVDIESAAAAVESFRAIHHGEFAKNARAAHGTRSTGGEHE